MKRIFALMLALLMLLSTTACNNTSTDENHKGDDTTNTTENADTTVSADETDHDKEDNSEQNTVSIIEPKVESGTMGEALWNAFCSTLADKPEIGMEELANTLLSDPVIQFTGMASPIEVGAEYFMGFGEYRITGYDSAAVYSPMMGSIAFVGYVFDLTENTDVNEFIKGLTDHCDPRWNICVEAEQTVVGAVGDKVFFVMCPKGEKNNTGDSTEGENNEQDPVSVIEPNVESGTMGEALWNAFYSTLADKPEIGMEELANTLLSDPVINFSGMVSNVTIDNEYFVGFGEYKIADFESAYIFSPMFGSMAFVGYVFDLDDNKDTGDFVKSLEEHCDPRWNICVEAEQTVVGAVDDKVFFVMCPKGEKKNNDAASAGTEMNKVEDNEQDSDNDFDDTLFIGDSRTVGIQEYGDIHEATYFAQVGMSVYNVREEKVQNTLLEDLLAEKTFSKIYIMLGINELGYDFEYTVSKYNDLIEWLCENEPDATVYIQANLHVTAERSDRDLIYNNQNIDKFNARIAELADNKQIFYLDVNSLFDDLNGNLSEDYADGDAHLLSNYYLTWTEWYRENIRKAV